MSFASMFRKRQPIAGAATSSTPVLVVKHVVVATAPLPPLHPPPLRPDVVGDLELAALEDEVNPTYTRTIQVIHRLVPYLNQATQKRRLTFEEGEIFDETEWIYVAIFHGKHGSNGFHSWGFTPTRWIRHNDDGMRTVYKSQCKIMAIPPVYTCHTSFDGYENGMWPVTLDMTLDDFQRMVDMRLGMYESVSRSPFVAHDAMKKIVQVESGPAARHDNFSYFVVLRALSHPALRLSQPAMFKKMFDKWLDCEKKLSLLRAVGCASNINLTSPDCELVDTPERMTAFMNGAKKCYCIPFERVVRLLAVRKCLLENGNAYVRPRDICDIMIQRMHWQHTLNSREFIKESTRADVNFYQDERVRSMCMRAMDRLKVIANAHMHTLGTSSQLTTRMNLIPSSVGEISQIGPPCMRNLALRAMDGTQDRHLKDKERLAFMNHCQLHGIPAQRYIEATRPSAVIAYGPRASARLRGFEESYEKKAKKLSTLIDDPDTLILYSYGCSKMRTNGLCSITSAECGRGLLPPGSTSIAFTKSPLVFMQTKLNQKQQNKTISYLLTYCDSRTSNAMARSRSPCDIGGGSGDEDGREIVIGMGIGLGFAPSVLNLVDN